MEQRKSLFPGKPVSLTSIEVDVVWGRQFLLEPHLNKLAWGRLYISNPNLILSIYYGADLLHLRSRGLQREFLRLISIEIDEYCFDQNDFLLLQKFWKNQYSRGSRFEVLLGEEPNWLSESPELIEAYPAVAWFDPEEQKVMMNSSQEFAHLRISQAA